MNLTRAAFLGRQAIKFGAIGLVVLIVGRMFLEAGVSYWKATHPPAPPPPTVGFGVLPMIRLPAVPTSQKPSAYQLEIPNSRFPEFPDRAKVFLMEKATPNLLADQRAKEIAANYGFVFAPTVLSDRLYRWTKTIPLQAVLEMDTQRFNFSIKTDYLSRVELINNKKALPSEIDAVQAVKSFLSAGQSLPVDMATSSGKVQYLKSLGGEVLPAVSFSDADFMQVDVMRNPVDGNKPFYTAKGERGILHAILSGGFGGRDQVVEMEFNYQPADYLQFHTYPLRSAQSAWQILQAGEAYIASKGTSDTAVVRDMSLGYYEDSEEQDYLQPIYVFHGDDGFMAFVPAIDPRYILPPTTQP